MISEKEYDNIQIGDSIVIDIDGGPIFQVIGHSSIGLIWTLADPICSKLSAFPILEGSIVDNNKFGGKYGYRFDRNEILEVRKFVPISSPPVVEKNCGTQGINFCRWQMDFQY